MYERKLVLFVEDNPEERELYGKLLWYNGFDVIFARDGQEGLELARSRRPALVLTDIMLPEMDGILLCQALRRDDATADIPVLALSGMPPREVAPIALRAGCADFLEKPISPYQVLRRIESIIGRPPLPGEVDLDAEASVA